jgi:hypothetical protein
MLDVSRDIRYGIDDCVCNDCGALIRTDRGADVDRFYKFGEGQPRSYLRQLGKSDAV